MKIRKKIVIPIVMVLLGLGLLFRFDPVFKRYVNFNKFSVEYEWRIFNNLYCNSKTFGHCYTNETNKTNAEIELYKQLLDNFNGDEIIEQKLKEIVRNTYRFDRTYLELTNSNEIKIDSLKKYKDEIFRQIILK